MTKNKKPDWNESLGWVVFFNERSPITKVSGKKDTIEQVKKFFEEKFEKLEAIFPSTVRMVSKQEFRGTCCIIGPTPDCEKLKEKIKLDNFATMEKNRLCVTTA